MKNFVLLFVVAVSLTLPQVYGESNRYIVKFKKSPMKAQTVSRMRDAPRGEIIRSLKNGYVIKLDEGVKAETLLNDEEVESVEQDRLMHLIEPTSIQSVDMNAYKKETVPHGIKRIKADTGGDYSHMTVAIIDTGIDTNNPDLKVIKAINFVNPEMTPKDDNGHGTHVAGTVAAKISGSGVVGVAPGAKLIALKVLAADGSGWMSDIIEAIDWVTDHADEIDVVNMSLGGLGNSGMMRASIKRSVNKGVVYVAAAGNSSMDIFGYSKNYFDGDNFYPASYPEVMTVSAMADTDGVSGGFGPKTSNGDLDDTLAWFSNFSYTVHPENPVISPGAGIDVAAPGVDILSYAPGNKLVKKNGTSMASPHVAGAVARFISEYGEDYMENGKRDAQFVYKIRQALIDLAEPQKKWNKKKDALDPDPNHEGLIQLP